MTGQELINMLLELQEHSERQADASLKQTLKDKDVREVLEQMAFTKRAIAWREAQAKEPFVEEEWQKFVTENFPEQSDHSWRDKIGKVPYKIAASFIGVLLVSGIAFAAVHIVQHISRDGGDLKSPQEVQISNSHQPLASDTIAADTIPAQQPVVFENVAIDKILNEVATYYSDKENPITVEFGKDEVRKLRFFFVWRKEAGLDKFIEQINHFESISITRQGNQLVVE